MQEMTSSTWKRTGSSMIWHPDLLADLVREIEPTPLRTLIGWLKTGFPETPPTGKQTVLVGGLQTTVETMMQTQTPDAVSDWLRQNALASVRAWKSQWPDVGLVFVMDGPASLFEFNEGDELVYFGRGRDRSKKVRLSLAMWNGAASGVGAYQVLVESSREVGGYFVRWLS
jgi:hypothetical protein